METNYIGNLLLAYEERLRGYAFRLTWDKDRADDLWQETAVRVLCNADKFEPGTGFDKWAQVIMHNVFVNNARREERYLAAGDLFAAVPGLLREMDGCCSDMSSRIEEIYNAVDELPGYGSKLMRLLIRGHKYVEIAVIMNLPLGTVKNRINLSRAVLRQRLKDYLN